MSDPVIAPPAPDAQAPPPDPSSLSAHRAAKANPAPVVVPVVEPEPDPEPLDPEIAAEVDKIEAAKPEESPQEKSARTKRNAKIAEKAIRTRLANARDREKDRADQLEARLRALEQPQALAPEPVQPVGAVFPTFDAWMADAKNADKNYDDWRDARDDFRHEQRESAQRASLSRAAAERQAAEIDTAYQARVAKAREKYPDFDSVTAAATFQIPPAHIPTAQDVLVAIKQSEIGPELSRHYATHQDEFYRVIAWPTQRALVELGKLEARLSAPPAPAAVVVPVSSAPAPHQPGGGGGQPAVLDINKPGTSLRDHRRVRMAEREAESRMAAR